MNNINLRVLIFVFVCISSIFCDVRSDTDFESVDRQQKKILKKSINGYIIEGILQSNETIINSEIPNMIIYMNGHSKEIYLHENENNFKIMDVEPGIYIMDILMKDYFIPSLKIIINGDDGHIDVRSINMNNPLVTKVMTYPIEVDISSKSNFYVPTPTFTVLSLIANPMILISLFGLLMMFITKPLADYLDKLEKEDAEKTDDTTASLTNKNSIDTDKQELIDWVFNNSQ